MSRRFDLQSAQGDVITARPYGRVFTINSSAPVGGEVGFAAGCEWHVPTGSGPWMYLNIGTNTSAVWIPADAGSGGQRQFGGASTGLYKIAAEGAIYKNILAAAGVSPSATGLDKIVDAFILPANALNAAGRGLRIAVYATAAATANNRNLQVVFGATNVTPLTDGTVTLTGGTVIGTTGTLATNDGGIVLECVLFKKGVAGSNTQESMTTNVTAKNAVGTIGKWTDQTFTETVANLIVVTANCTTAATDVLYNGCVVEALN